MQMAILFVVVIAGYVCNRLGYVGGEWDRKMSSLILNVTCPALILNSVMGPALPDRQLIAPLLLVGFVTYAVLTPIAVFLPRLLSRDVSRQGIYGFMMMFGNVGFIGYPIVSALFGAKAVFYASLLNFPNTLFVFTVGQSLIAQGNGHKGLHFDPKVLISPSMMASYIAIAIVALNVGNLPVTLSRPIELLGNMTVPGALLIIGSQMAQLPKRQMLGTPRIYLVTLLKLIVLPEGLYFFFRMAGADPLVCRINTVVIAMPVASYGTILCLKAGKDMTLITQGTFVTNLLSILTIPLITQLFTL